MSKPIIYSGIKLCNPKNIRAMRVRSGGEFQASKTIERFYKQDEKILGGEVIAFICDDGEILSIFEIEAVLWIDCSDPSKKEHWIDVENYEGEYSLPDEYEDWNISLLSAVSFKSLLIRPKTQV